MSKMSELATTLDNLNEVGKQLVGCGEELIRAVAHVLSYEPAQPFAHIQQFELCKQIHKSVTAGRACQSHNALHAWTHFHKALESFSMPAFEG